MSTESKSGALSSCMSELYASGSPFIVVSTATRLPCRRPLLPRISSATSGFFFCGMIDEPVAHASANSTKPNSAVAHSVRSAASRERCTPVMAAAARYSST